MTISTKVKATVLGFAALHIGFAAINSAYAAGDPTQGRIQKRQAQNQAEYHRCARFALSVYQGGLSQAGNNSSKIRAARSHYHANLARCRALL